MMQTVATLQGVAFIAVDIARLLLDRDESLQTLLQQSFFEKRRLFFLLP